MRASFLTLILLCTCLFANEAKLLTDKTALGANEAAIVTLDVVIEEQFAEFPSFPESEEYSAQLVKKNQYYVNNYQNINGKVTRQKGIQTKLYYQVSFNKTGSVKLPPLSFTVKGKEYTTNGITFSIGTNKVDKGIAVKFIQSDITLYRGQQSKLTVRIMVKDGSNNRISNSGLRALLDEMQEKLSGVFRMHALNPDGINPKTSLINGSQYTIYDIEFEVSALKTGKHRFGPFSFSYYEEKESSDPFGRGFGSSFFTSSETVEKVLSTPALAYEVKQRPRAPKGFKGAMSRIILEGDISKTETKVGESVTLNFSVRGKVPEGVLKEVDMPEIEHCDVFAPETKLEQDTRPSGVYSKRNFSYMLIPQKEGILTIPQIKYVWFDVESGRYKTEAIGPFSVSVGKGEDNGTNGKRYLSQSKISTVGEDIQFIHLQLPKKAESIKIYKNRFYHYLLLIPWVGILILVLVKIRIRFVPKNEKAETRKKAFAKAIKELESIDTDKKELSPVAVFETYLYERAAIQAGSLTKSELRSTLEEHNISQKTIDSVIAVLEQIEMARYAGTEGGAENISAVREVIKTIEKEL